MSDSNYGNRDLWGAFNKISLKYIENTYTTTIGTKNGKNCFILSTYEHFIEQQTVDWYIMNYDFQYGQYG